MTNLLEDIFKFVIVAVAAIILSALFLYSVREMRQTMLNTTKPVEDVILNKI